MCGHGGVYGTDPYASLQLVLHPGEDTNWARAAEPVGPGPATAETGEPGPGGGQRRRGRGNGPSFGLKVPPP